MVLAVMISVQIVVKRASRVCGHKLATEMTELKIAHHLTCIVTQHTLYSTAAWLYS